MRPCKFITLVCSMATAGPLSAVAGDVTRVSVLDAGHQPIRTMTSVPDLVVFGEIWATRVKVNAGTAMRPGYSIVIQQSDRRSERWLYDDAGIVQALSIWKTPVYRVSSPAAFNEILGIRAP
jgi:hypothetical protein